MKKSFSIFLAILIITLSLGTGAAALEPVTGTLNVMTYNVSGIPVIGDFQGTQRALKGNARMAKIGEILNSESGCDIIGTQEDFNHHAALADAMPAFPYRTYTSGGAPLGDGLNAFSKYPLYNVNRTKWNNSYGVISGSTDRLAQKGILSTVIEIADGVLIDFYVIHVEAGGDAKSSAARADNYRQLAEMINTRAFDRPIIVVGDYNAGFVRRAADGLFDYLIKPTGLKDCWAEIHNNGDYIYDDGGEWNPTLYETVDRVMFKSGGGVELDAKTLQYIQYVDEQGKTFTDHIATKVRIDYTVTGEPINTQPLEAPKPFDPFQRFVDGVASVFKTLFLIFTNLHELVYLIEEGLELLQQGA